MFNFAFLLFPFVFAGAIYWLAFRFAGRSKSPRKSVTQIALMISAALTFAFIVWSAISLASQGPTGKVLGMVFLNFFMLGIGLVSFILAWPAVYAARYVAAKLRWIIPLKDRQYLDFKRFEREGYPCEEDLFYECLRCGEIISSMPSNSCGCGCGNIVIDVDAGRLGVDSPLLARAFRIRK